MADHSIAILSIFGSKKIAIGLLAMQKSGSLQTPTGNHTTLFAVAYAPSVCAKDQ